MRLIDADALLEKSWDADTRCGYVQVVDVGEIENAPTIEAEPKRRVSLVESGYLLNEIDELDWYRISNGNFIEGAKEVSEAFYRAEDIYRVIKNARRYNFCPNCGAKMDEEDNQ